MEKHTILWFKNDASSNEVSWFFSWNQTMLQGCPPVFPRFLQKTSELDPIDLSILDQLSWTILDQLWYKMPMDLFDLLPRTHDEREIGTELPRTHLEMFTCPEVGKSPPALPNTETLR